MADHDEMREAIRRAILHDRANERLLVSIFPLGLILAGERTTEIFDSATVLPHRLPKGQNDEQEANHSTP